MLICTLNSHQSCGACLIRREHWRQNKPVLLRDVDGETLLWWVSMEICSSSVVGAPQVVGASPHLAALDVFPSRVPVFPRMAPRWHCFSLGNIGLSLFTEKEASTDKQTHLWAGKIKRADIQSLPSPENLKTALGLSVLLTLAASLLYTLI